MINDIKISKIIIKYLTVERKTTILIPRQTPMEIVIRNSIAPTAPSFKRKTNNVLPKELVHSFIVAQMHKTANKNISAFIIGSHLHSIK